MPAQSSPSKNKKKATSKSPAKKASGKKAEVKAAREQLLKELFEPNKEKVVEENPMEQKVEDLENSQSENAETVNVDMVAVEVSSDSEQPVVHDETPNNPHADAFEGDPNQESDDGRKKWILNLLIILFGAVLVVLLYFYLQSLRLGHPPQKPAVPTVSETQVKPTVTPIEVTLTKKDLAKYPIEVLNGSGIRGEAAKVQELLEGSDYVVSDIGNANNSKYEETVIQYGAKVPKEFVDMLYKELGKTYIVKKEGLDEESGLVTVIVGSLTSDSEKTTTKKATPTPEE